MDEKITEVSKLLEQDLNDDLIVMKLVTYPKPELIIAGLIKKIKEERNKFNEQINSIYKRMDEFETRTKDFNEKINSVNQIVDLLKTKGSIDNEPKSSKDLTDLYYSKY